MKGRWGDLGHFQVEALKGSVWLQCPLPAAVVIVEMKFPVARVPWGTKMNQNHSQRLVDSQSGRKYTCVKLVKLGGLLLKRNLAHPD